MNCPSCSHANPDAARFCNGCGAALALHCPGCGRDNPPGSRFCNACGSSLAARSPATAETRKIVSILFADLIGSTSLHERLDPESVSRLMDRYYQAVRGPVEAHGGTVVQLLGDGVMCAFGVPRVGEDDAIRAVRAAVGIQNAFREFALEQRDAVGHLGLRVAINTGEVVVSDEQPAGIGDPLNVAARLQQEAHDGDVVIGEATQRLVRALVTVAPFGTFTLKGRSEPVAAYRVVSLERPAAAAASVFVGRDEELGRLVAVYDAAVAERRARLAVLLGSPGLGKSRLIAELGHRFGQQATVLVAHCDAAGGATFAPIANALRTLLALDDAAGPDAQRAAVDAVVHAPDAERARIASGIIALLAGTPASPEETFFVIRRMLSAVAATRPVVLAIDDLHWAEPLLLDLTEHLVQWSTDVPLLVLVAARLELRDTRSSLTTPGDLVTDVVTLGGLDAASATRLAASVIGADALPAAIAGRVLATSDGNPLFLGELVRMLVHDGALKREGDRWTTGVELATLEMPPTIQALLAARIERLRPEERTVLERAAVVGRQFSRAAVDHLLPRELHAELDVRLESLRRSELIEPDLGWFLGEPVLRFHHVLIRDAAYRRVLKGTRAELHGRVAEWIETRVGEAIEHDETIGWHLEQAHRHLSELGPLDARGRALGDRASRYLAAAGRRALERDDLPLAAGLLGRSIERLDTDDPARADLALDWCEALLAAGDVGPAAKALDELGRFTEGSDRLRAWQTCLAGERAVLTDPQAMRATVDAVAAAAAELAAAGDGPGEAKAHSVHAIALARLGKVGACEAALDKALAAARRAHDRRRSNAVLAGAPRAALWGPSPVARASGRCLDVVRVLRITQGAPAVEAVALRCQAVLEAFRGRTDAAQRMIASSRRMIEELGITHQLLETDLYAGLIDLIEGNAVAAERRLRAAYEGLRTHGLGIDAARAAAWLGQALLAQGRAAEAEALSRDSEALAGDDLEAAITWRGVRAEALARRGEDVAAIEFARAAVDIASATDALLLNADARRALAAALRAAGRRDESDAEDQHAIALWAAKGATVVAERARRDAGLSQLDRAPNERAAPARPARRRVRPNAATAQAARIDATIAARNADALPALIADEAEFVHHPTRSTYGREGALSTYHALLRGRDLVYRHEPLATLGESLALYRLSVSASGVAGGKFDVGAVENESISLMEVDTLGRLLRGESFATDRLGNAIARLYKRYAELLPDGPQRARATATARSVATASGPMMDVDAYGTTWSSGVVYVDHRTIGLGSAEGLEAVRRVLGTLLELADGVTNRVDDVLAHRADALLLRVTNFGTDRTSGGAYERHFLWLGVFGTDGLGTRIETFDGDRETEALARFDDLAEETPAPRLAPVPSHTAEQYQRRVRQNAATANAAHLDAAVAGRDADAFLPLLADDLEGVHHPTGATYDQQRSLAMWRFWQRAQDLTFATETLATLGDSLALCRVSISGSGIAAGEFDVGAYELEGFVLIEVDALGRRARHEMFAITDLGDAVARLYERYAELLPEGPQRARATATARTVAVTITGPINLERYAAVWASSYHMADHRVFGTWASRTPAEALHHFRLQLDLAPDLAHRCEDVLALEPHALLVRESFYGTARDSGGAFENRICMIFTFGADGLATHVEVFEAEHEAKALARFDEPADETPATRLAPVPSRAAEQHQRRVRPNAATALAARIDATIAARNLDALPALIADEAEVVHHPTRSTYGREGVLSTYRAVLRGRDLVYRHEPMATLGESLALGRLSVSASGVAGGKFDVGAYENESIILMEVDTLGRLLRGESFATDRLGNAIVRLYDRYAELLPDGPQRARAAATARSVAVYCTGPFDPDRLDAVHAPDIEAIDHRILGHWFAHGAEALLRQNRSWLDVGNGMAARDHDILALEPGALLLRRTFSGIDRAGGGAFERQFILLCTLGSDGLVTRTEYFDADREAEALARFDELAAEPAARASRAAAKRDRRVRPNAATTHVANLNAAMAARDADALPALFSDEVEVVDHPTGSTYGREGVLGTYHAVLRAQDPVFRTEPLATLGESLVLHHWSISASGVAGGKFDVGAYENDGILLIEVDTQGRARRREAFAPDHLGDAVLRLYERYPETLPDGPARTRAAVIARFLAWLGRDFELDRAAQAVAPSVEYVDHRRIIGVGSLHGAEAFLQMMRTERELSASALHRMDDVLALRSDALLGRFTTFGTDRGGGPHERSYLTLFAFGSAGRVTRLEEFDDDCVAEALARFDTLQADATEGPTTGSPVVRFENAATRYGARFREAWEARDWERVAAMPAPGLRVIDRRAMMRMDLDRDAYLASLRYVFDLRSSRFTERVLATRGDRLALARLRFEASDRDVGPSESEYLLVTVVADHGDAVALVAFDVADLEAAYAELDERYVAGEAASYARTWESSRSIVQAIDARDWEQLAAVFAPGFVLKDHRPLGLLNSLSRDEWVASVRALLDLRPDAHFRIHHVLALDDRRWLTIQAWEGDEAEGEFEIGAACVMSCGAEGIEQWQAYNLDQLDAAWAQFDALGMSGQADGGAGPGPAATHDALAALAKPNAATRAMVRVGGLMRARDWEGCRALTSTDFTYEDRCRHALVTGDVEVWIRSMQEVTSWPGIGLNRASIGTFGDRIEVIREMWKGEPNTGAFEIEFIRLVEVAADGRLVANVKFDVEDRRAALAEAHARFVAGEAAANGGQTLFLALARAFARHDWEAFRACLSPDAVICDRRTPAVLGTIGRDQWVTSLRALSELAPDVTVECMRILTWNDRGRVDVTRQFGTTRDGGPFETVVVRVLVTDGAHLRRNEVFDVADTEPALARFAELCGGDGAAP